MNIDNFYIDCLLKIGSSLICGILLGLERKSRNHTVGMRTVMLISVSSTILTMLSILIPSLPGVSDSDATRIAAGIVTGIGFLGGGAILQYGLNIRGLTTAAIIFTAAALGIACGAGQYYIAGVSLVIILIFLIIFERIEYHFFPAKMNKTLTIEFNDSDIDLTQIRKDITKAGLFIKDTNMSESIEKQKYVLKLTVKAPNNFDLRELSKSLSETGKLVKMSISDL